LSGRARERVDLLPAPNEMISVFFVTCGREDPKDPAL